jgi:hypothetical protein
MVPVSLPRPASQPLSHFRTQERKFLLAIPIITAATSRDEKAPDKGLSATQIRYVELVAGAGFEPTTFGL